MGDGDGASIFHLRLGRTFQGVGQEVSVVSSCFNSDIALKVARRNFYTPNESNIAISAGSFILCTLHALYCSSGQRCSEAVTSSNAGRVSPAPPQFGRHRM